MKYCMGTFKLFSGLPWLREKRIMMHVSICQQIYFVHLAMADPVCLVKEQRVITYGVETSVLF